VAEQLLLFDIAPIREYMDPACADCDIDVAELGEHFMVHDEVWPIGKRDGQLCIGCIETRIGRQLTPADFTDCRMNRWPGHSQRLTARLTGSEEP
jgi:hypothetical protein